MNEVQIGCIYLVALAVAAIALGSFAALAAIVVGPLHLRFRFKAPVVAPTYPSPITARRDRTLNPTPLYGERR